MNAQQQDDGASKQQPADVLRLVPLVAGAAGIAGVVLNRSLSGIAPVVTATSAQSRADVLAIMLAATLLLTGLQWLSIKPRVHEAVAPEGKQVRYLIAELPAAVRQEVEWAWSALQSATSASCLALFHKGRCVAYLGWAAAATDPAAAAPGPLCQQAMSSGAGNYLPNLLLFPGRLELLAYMPPNTQAALVQPVGATGAVVVGGARQREFTRLDQAWLVALAEKLEATLEQAGFAPAGSGFA